ncbi:alpha/beta hydrolase family protein [Namhaeicola litoreus]|uniref:Alpha/beta hydrolase family protein n=1 Tax=Namhaeicola litoreus TaxID=1052145 RepID=A0ABW3Y0A3_9FLAO
MITLENIQIKGKHQRPILLDLVYPQSNQKKPLVIFCHGYKGFKDWGPWNLVAQNFAAAGFTFAKFNFSHNGGTVEQPIDFPDLEAFGQNNFIKELDDVASVLDWLLESPDLTNEIDEKRIALIGHSRGGAIATIKASEDKRVSHIVSWAGVSDFAVRFPKGEPLENWKSNGVAYIENLRTKQKMPHYIQFYENFKENEERLTIKNAVQKLSIPHLIVQGTEDENVRIEEGKNLHHWNPKSELLLVENGNHTFNSAHPYHSDKLNKELLWVVQQTIDFITDKI